jgi:hypothetical protein
MWLTIEWGAVRISQTQNKEREFFLLGFGLFAAWFQISDKYIFRLYYYKY